MGPKHSHALCGVGLIMFILFMSVESMFKVLYLLVFIGLNWWFWLDSWVLVLQRVHFLGFLGLLWVLGGVEN